MGTRKTPSRKGNGAAGKSSSPAQEIPSITDASKGADEIRFYRANEKPYGALSNLFRRALTFEGREYPTAEHAYQAGKARTTAVREWILSAPTPGLVAMAAHGLYTWDINSNWSKIKYERMRQVLRAKFSQHDDLRDLLISTGQARLVEVGKVDNLVNRTWGEVNGKGMNMLGVLLMEVRDELSRVRVQPKATSASQSKNQSVSKARLPSSQRRAQP